MQRANQETPSEAPAVLGKTGAPALPKSSFAIQVATIMALVWAAVFGVAWWQAGSMELAWPWLSGKRLLFEPSAIDCGVVARGEIVERHIRVVNLTSKPLRLTGAQQSCQCITLDTFPIVIEKGKEHQLALKVGAPKTSGPFGQSIKIFTDDRGSTSVAVNISGSVRD